MPDETKFRVAVVGGAGVWGRYYLRAYAAHPRCDLIALVDTARERRQSFADCYGVERIYDTVDQLLADEVPDIVSASVPVAYNREVVLACARAGVRALSCEKPLAPCLSDADEMVRICRETGTAFGCGTAHWEVPHLIDIARWIAEGNIGDLTGVAIPGGLPDEVSGAGCVQLTMMRLLTGAEVEWVEGHILPRDERWLAPDGAAEEEIDGPAYGRLCLTNGLICEIPAPDPENPVPCRVSVTGTGGQVWAVAPHPALIRGFGPDSTPVFPDFMNENAPEEFFTPAIERLMTAAETGEEAQCSGHDYRQALEIAIAIVHSAARGGERISLPLEDRSVHLYPHLYRLRGGDAVPWEKIGYSGPPEPLPLTDIASFADLTELDDDRIRQILRQVDRRRLAVALQGADEAVRTRFLDSFSGRGRRFMRRRMEEQEEVSPAEVEKARERILYIARIS